VKNAGVQAVNIRKDADINSAIIGSMQPGEVITGYGKEPTGRWILVRIKTAYGWISADKVELNPPLMSIPVIATIPSP
jgi:SH3-like domain-containing protein